MKLPEKKYFILLLLFMVHLNSAGQNFKTGFFSGAGVFFDRFVYDGKVDYKVIKKNPESLNNLIRMADLANISDATTDAKIAFWVNVYNLLVIKQVTDNYPLNSVDEIPGFFSEHIFEIQNEKLTLGDIESKKLKGYFRNPRISFLICKGHIGDPPLRNESYNPETFTTQVTDQISFCVNSPDFVKMVRNDTLRLSSFFYDHKQEIEFNAGSLSQFINRYRKKAVVADSAVTFFSASYQLNDDLSDAENKTPNDTSVHYIFPNRELASEADDGKLAGLIIIPHRHLEIRINNNINTFTEFYTRKLSRNTTRFSYASDILTLQILYGLGRNTNAGISLNGRTIRIGEQGERATDVFNLKTDSNATFYLRSVTPLIRFNISKGYFNVRMQNYFNFPVTRIKPLKYNNTRVTDDNPWMLVSQLYIFHDFSEYVRSGIETDFSFRFDNRFETVSFSPRPLFNTVFGLPLNKSFRIYGLLESAPSANTSDYLSNYYLKEGAGLTLSVFKSEFTLYYSYIFLGKNVNAFNSLVVNLRIGI